MATGGNGTRQAWRRNGRELFFLDGANALSSVPVDTSSTTFTSGNPSRLLETRYFALPGPRPFDVSADGERFLMIKDAPSGDDKTVQTGLVVVERWFEELKARLRTP